MFKAKASRYKGPPKQTDDIDLGDLCHNVNTQITFTEVMIKSQF